MTPQLSETKVQIVDGQPSLLTDLDLYFFAEGTHYRLYERLGAHYISHDEHEGLYFAVWAPNAEGVSVVGDFNGWNPNQHWLRSRASSGIWEGFFPGLPLGARYKYHILFKDGRGFVDKADPFAARTEPLPGTASMAWDLDYDWGDEGWMQARKAFDIPKRPINNYEMRPGWPTISIA
jgi:1,4-alpha-glucan branching enzyme